MKKGHIQFVTLFPDCPNLGLVKDVGQIPYMLSKTCENIEGKLVSCCIDMKGSNIDSVNGLKIEKCARVLENDFLSGALYLLQHAKDIDWLNLYHCRKRTYVWAKLYKWLNPKGKVYLKLDIGFVGCELFERDKKNIKTFNRNISVMDLVSVESNAVLRRLKNITDCDLKLIHNGFCETNSYIDVSLERENTFVTLARLGTFEKATDILLDAFAKSADKHDWNLKLIGPIEPEFQSFIDDFFERNPALRSRIQMTGEITDRSLIYREVSKAKVFVLPSRWEGFPLVLPEAMMCGCHTLISSNVPPSDEMTGKGKYGEIFLSENVDQLSEKMILATTREYTAEMAKEISDYAWKHFSWREICSKLYTYLG